MGAAIAAQLAFQRVLQQAFSEVQLRNPAYSLRAFAQRLALSPSALSEILNGKRRVSRKVAERVTRKLCLAPLEANALLELFTQPPGTELPSTPGDSYIQLSADQFHVVSEWYHFAILSLAETLGFRAQARWISERLNIRLAEAEAALERLERMELLARNGKGELRPTGKQFSTTDEIRDLALQKAHVKNMELAIRSLEKDPVETRDCTATTMAIDPKRLPVAKQMIREFQDKLCAYLESGDRAEVYKISIQLFPLTQRKEPSYETE